MARRRRDAPSVRVLPRRGGSTCGSGNCSASPTRSRHGRRRPKAADVRHDPPGHDGARRGGAGAAGLRVIDRRSMNTASPEQPTVSGDVVTSGIRRRASAGERRPRAYRIASTSATPCVVPQGPQLVAGRRQVHARSSMWWKKRPYRSMVARPSRPRRCAPDRAVKKTLNIDSTRLIVTGIAVARQRVRQSGREPDRRSRRARDTDPGARARGPAPRCRPRPRPGSR